MRAARTIVPATATREDEGIKRAVKKILWIAIPAALIAGLILLVQQRQGGGTTHEAQQELMGTIVKIKAHGKELSRGRFDEVSRSAFAEIARLEKEMSEWIPESPISQAARFAGRKAVPVSEEIVAVIDLSLAVSRQTGGAFDISFKPLGRLWRVEKRKEPPQEEEIRAALRLVDYRNIVLDKGRRTLFLKRPGMAVGLGAIAKGYAAGRAARKMAEGGIRDFIIDAGGDLYFSGSKGGKAWTCGIQDPDRKGEQADPSQGQDGLRRRHERRLRAVFRFSGEALPPHHRHPDRIPGDGDEERDGPRARSRRGGRLRDLLFHPRTGKGRRDRGPDPGGGLHPDRRSGQGLAGRPDR